MWVFQDVGQSILESYSRVLESLAFNVLSRINDVIRVDDVIKCNQNGILSRKPINNRDAAPKGNAQLPPKSPHGHHKGLPKSASLHMMHATSPPRMHQNKSLSELTERSEKELTIESKEFENLVKSPPWPGLNRPWSYSGSVNALRSPPSRD